jgi:hypothetical protein
MTYTNGLTFITKKDITQNNIITLCNLLNNHELFNGLCTFEPEPITEGGIIFKYINGEQEWYKSMRLGLSGKDWPWICNPMVSWLNNNNIIIKKDIRIYTYLKSFRNAPVFTQDELRAIEECFNKIDVYRVSRMVGKARLKRPTNPKYG